MLCKETPSHDHASINVLVFLDMTFVVCLLCPCGCFVLSVVPGS